MEGDINTRIQNNSGIQESLIQIKQYLETDINTLKRELYGKEKEIKILKEESENIQHLAEGNRQLINKLLGDISKLQNDIEWYKKTYEKRSFLGVVREKLFRRH